jgi:hypothetical protein
MRQNVAGRTRLSARFVRRDGAESADRLDNEYGYFYDMYLFMGMC